MPTIDFTRIRSTPKSRNDSFEALAVQLFRAKCPAPPGSTFFSLRGDGGDGGVEAFFRTPSGDMLGVQAKYFFELGAAELGQIDDSLKTALSNHPMLKEYWVYIPFDLTGRVAAGKRGKSQAERFENWKASVESEAKTDGRSLSVILCTAAVVRDQLQRLDTHGGIRRYWFDDTTLTSIQVERCLEQARDFAGPRYFSELDVVTNAHEALDFFGDTADFQHWRERVLVPKLAEARSLFGRRDAAFGLLSVAERQETASLFEEVTALMSDIHCVATANAKVEQARALLTKLYPLLVKARQSQEEAFFEKYGADKDTPGFRQFNAEYMCTFPAGAMDAARDLERVSDSLGETLASPELEAATAKSLLLVGPAGVGKTHAIVSAAYRRFYKGAFSLIVFGDDFQGGEPWEILRAKLGFGSTLGRDALLECLQACAENTGLPFVIFIDALNESPREARWKVKLPELLQQCKPYPGIKVCVSTRDTYRHLVVDSRFPGFAFEHSGFGGREFEALQAFAAFYGLDSEITPLFAAELTNPLFLHLACRTLKEEGRLTLDVSLPGFSALFERHLNHSNASVRERLEYANPRNLVRAAMLILAELLTSSSDAERTWTKCADALRGLVGSELAPESLLRELEREGLIILTASEDDKWLVRLGYQRYGDVLRATSVVEACLTSSGSVDLALVQAKVASLSPDDEGLLEVLAAVLPEKTGIEITHGDIGLEPTRANRLFVLALPWRSRDSVSEDIQRQIFVALTTPGLWQEVYEVFFKLSLVPGHRLNAENWLVPFMWRESLANRDPYLSLAAFKSYDADGAVKSLIDASLRADVSRWPSESRRLVTRTLSWLTSCSDRRVRDRAAKGLARVLGFEPTLAADLAEAFDGCDDDYVLEAVSLAIYSACLLERGDRRTYVAALDALVSSGYDTPNVLVRDTVRLLAGLLSKMGLPKALQEKLKCYPRRVSPPSPWPTLPDAQPLLDLEHLPLNMKLWGSSLGPDFWRYQVQSRVAEFDLAGVGITHENLATWVMVEALNLGYPGHQEGALHFDRTVNYEYGSGRSRSGYAERLGKKYYWIALHRLLGVLADNVKGRESYAGRRPSLDCLWSVRVRKCDLTDVRDIATEQIYPDEILAGPGYAFPPRESEIKAWVRTDDFSPHEHCVVRTDANGAQWIALALSARDSDRAEEEDGWSKPYLGVELLYSSILAKKEALWSGAVGWLESAFSRSEPSFYRGYLAEYPDGPVFQQCVDEGEASVGPNGMTFSVVTLSRGGEWEYEYTADERQDHLQVPCQDIVRDLNLSWDLQRGWRGNDGSLVAFESKAKRRSGFFIRRAVLDEYLTRTDKVLLLHRFANRGNFDLGGDSGSQIDISTHLQYNPIFGPDVLHERYAPFNC